MNALTPAQSFAAGLSLGLGLMAAHWAYSRRSLEDEDDDDEWESDGDEEESEDEATVNDEAKGHMKMVLVVRTDLKVRFPKANLRGSGS